MKAVLKPLNTSAGDLEGNAALITDCIRENPGEHFFVFPEMCLSSYPSYDLWQNKDLVLAERNMLSRIAELAKGKLVILGASRIADDTERKYSDPTKMKDSPFDLKNCAYVLFNGRVAGFQDKFNLPSYDIFFENRYFNPGKDIYVFMLVSNGDRLQKVLNFVLENGMLREPHSNFRMNKWEAETKYSKGHKVRWLGLSVCEDIWVKGSVPYIQGEFGCDIFINISASPFYAGKAGEREKLLVSFSKKYRGELLYVNRSGAEDHLLFDGASLYLKNGKTAGVSRPFRDDALKTAGKTGRKVSAHVLIPREEELFNALIAGIRNYFVKNGFTKAVIGLSGGLDSAVVAVLAAKALGPRNVTGIMMPGPYSSDSSEKDALECAKRLGIKREKTCIGLIYSSYIEGLGIEQGKKVSLTEQNIQSRIRGNILMARANSLNALVLSTGNKSELAMGYCTLYGDMAGALSPIADIFKTDVYKIAGYINARFGRPIPAEIIRKAPSAELAPGQMDEDDLPPYAILDRILGLYLEERLSADEIVKKGFEKKTVKRIIDNIRRTEFKRKQAAVSLKVSVKAFGPGRIMPISDRSKDEA